MDRVVKVAGVQSSPKILDVRRKLERLLKSMKIAAENGAKLLVFPECSLSGYCFSDLEEALRVAETIPGPSVNTVASLCRDLGVYVVMGLLEEDSGECFNSAVLIGPHGLIGKYRKLHLPYLGVDRFASHGDLPLKVYNTEVGNIGMNICFDTRFPETARVLSLLGAEIVLLPTNWPEGAEFIQKCVVNTRAYENRVHFVAVNRVGWERGFRFIGQSKIVHCSGATLVEASSSEEEIIYANLTPEESRKKHVVIKKDKFEVNLFKERRPEHYRLISKCN
jgi:predicted amidohydrolase